MKLAEIYRRSSLFKFGFWGLVVGAGPLLAIIVLAAVGIWPDPNPNPIGPGLLFFFSFWPSVICLGIGWWRARKTEGE